MLLLMWCSQLSDQRGTQHIETQISYNYKHIKHIEVTFYGLTGIMPYYQTWEEFSRAAEKLYLTDPMKVRVVMKYRHCDGNISVKITDDAVCLQYKTDQAQDVKKIEKLHSKIMRLMVSKETHQGDMETD